MNKEYKILDNGFLKLIDFMGDDKRIVKAARISYRGESVKRKDEELIDYLIRNGHTSPLEQVVFTFHVKAPIFIARQWMRHRTARINEVSRCYSLAREEFYVPLEEDLKCKIFNNKSKIEFKPLEKSLSDKIKHHQKHSYELYQDMINSNIPKELSRIVLPLSLYTEWYWQIDLNNLFHFIKLRLALDSPKEIKENSPKEMREYAKALVSIVREIVPTAFNSFENHFLRGKRFSGEEIAVIINALDLNKLNMDAKKLELLKDKLGID
ncbi:FAD-dependent thymidylate synthase [Borreliella bissettiae]|uniref:Flavin-dependent thymidylate synthase n=1 Tax=Borrelia bissettiae (strain DSM 17990 / CIP 109136 / DN127) TaxID=521010 RepID=G0APJ5_BORBD|nr:FAD-dependent thymidylate synthase [Borreliella bissettiae]AEL19621.1 thymidylate synthase, flavin-dependent [Borreliella bissettiae DN127]WKD00372.1 FAD-dependent thymidylate synthase [Borreliella bissettiae]